MDAQAALTAGSGPQLVLASASPRRAELLRQLGLRFVVQAQDVPEQPGHTEAAADYVLRVARAKAQAGWEATGRSYGLPVLGADTEVLLDGQVLGKPQGRDAALAMLGRLSGREHQVCSAVVVTDGTGWQMRCVKTTVSFATLSAAQVAAYWETGEPVGKAGAYAIQGRGAAFISHISGSYSGVVGLPLFETAELLREFGINPLPV